MFDAKEVKFPKESNGSICTEKIVEPVEKTKTCKKDCKKCTVQQKKDDLELEAKAKQLEYYHLMAEHQRRIDRNWKVNFYLGIAAMVMSILAMVAIIICNIINAVKGS